MDGISKQLQIFIMFFAVIIGMIMIDWVSKVIFNKRFVKLRFFPKFSIREMSFISIMIAITVTFVSILMAATPLAGFPSIKISIEALIIKIIGFLFGPAIGIISGLLTETLTELFFPFYYHWGYTLVICGYGLIAGIVKIIYDKTSKNETKFMFVGIGLIGMLIAGGLIYTATVNHLMIDFYFTKKTHTLINKWFVLLGFAATMSLPIVALIISRIVARAKKWPHERYVSFAAIIILIAISEIFINALMLPVFDAQVFDMEDAYVALVTSKFFFMPANILTNMVVITVTYRMIQPLVKSTMNSTAQQMRE